MESKCFFLKAGYNYIAKEKDLYHYKLQKVGKSEQLVDNNESITPTTDKGYLNKDNFFQEVFKKLEALKKVNDENPDYYTGVPSSLNLQIKSQDDFNKFLENQKSTIEPLLNNAIFIKRYQYNDSKSSDVIRFGIDKKCPEIENLFKIFEKEDGKSVSITSTIKEDALFENINKIRITDYEEHITKMALTYLETLECGKCVLIDVFDRKNSDIHTCVLVKQGQNHLLLDPSNPSFSIFLKQVSKDLCVYTDKNKTIYTPIKDTETGPESYQSRDCIDIAAKIAFAINNNNEEISLLLDNRIDVTKMGLNHSIESITNCTKISGLFPKEVEKNVFRVKQSSNIKESKKASTLLKYFEKVNDFFEAIEKDPISKKEMPKYNKLNLEYKESIKHNIKDLSKSFYSEILPLDVYSDAINHYYNGLKGSLKQDGELELLGVELTHEFDYIDNHYGN